MEKNKRKSKNKIKMEKKMGDNNKVNKGMINERT